MRSVDWDSLIRAMVLIHIGQQLGASGRFARMIYDATELVVTIWR